MAAECWDLIGCVDLAKEWRLDSSAINQLEEAIEHLPHVAVFLCELELVYPKNAISAQLRPLFVEARDGLHSHIKDQGEASVAIRMTSKVLIKRKIAKVLKIVTLENIAERIKASKPSRSSTSPITMEMVGFLEAFLDSMASCPYRVQLRHPLVSVLKQKVRYLRVLFTLTAKRCIAHESMKDFFIHAEDVAYSAAHLCLLRLAYNMDWEIFQFLQRINPFRPELRQMYMNVLKGLKSSGSKTTANTQNILDFVSALRDDLEELLSRYDSMKVSFDALQQGLSYLSQILWGIKSYSFSVGELIPLQSHMEALAIEAAIAIYSSDEEMDKKTTEHMCFLLQLNFNHVEVEVHLIHLLNCQATIIAPLVDLIDYLLGELIFIRTFLMDALEQCKDQIKITDFLKLIQLVTSEAWSDISYLSHNAMQEDSAREINRLHFQLLLEFKFIKAVIRQLCPKISASPSLDHTMINLLNFLPRNFDVIESYFSMIKCSKTSSSDCHKMDELLMGFQEYILDNLLPKYETDLTCYVSYEVRKFYSGLFLLVTYFVDPPVQCIGCKKQNSLLTGSGNITIEAKSSMYLTYDDAVDSNKSRKVDLVLRCLAEAFKLVKCYESVLVILTQRATADCQIPDVIKRAHKEIIFLGAFFMDVLRQHTELNKLHQMLIHAEMIFHMLAQILGFCFDRHLEKMSSLLSDLLQEIESFKVEVRKKCFPVLDASPCNMTDGEDLINFLLNHKDRMFSYDACSISFLKNQIPIVQEKLVNFGHFLADIVHHRDMHNELKDLVKRVQDRNYVCFFPVRGYRPDWYYMLYLLDVNQLLNFVEAEVKKFYLEVPYSTSYCFPKTNGLGFLDFFLDKLEELLCSKVNCVIYLKHHIRSVKESLLSLRSLADKFAESYDEHDEVNDLISSITEIAYKVEYVIDSCLASSHSLQYKFHWISEVIENIKLVHKVANATRERKKIDVTAQKVKKTSTNLVLSVSANIPRSNEDIVGFHDVMDQISKQLLGGSSQLDVISLVGMPGIGKTTLAKKIYIDLIVTGHFDIHAKCHVTQVYSWRELLLTILSDVCEPADRTAKGDGELADELRRFLMTKRFLILIDDVWDKKVWDNFLMCFKDARNGSRILLTTRLSDVASYAQCESKPYHLRLFRDDESWTLLQKEVFQGKTCPSEIVDVGFRIAKSCGGLPLFIVLVAGVLKDKKKKAELWKEMEETLALQNIGSLEESLSIIGFSYKNLPRQLKPCLLYFGGLLRGKDIQVSKLTQLWVAEGFVQANEEKGSEDVAEGFLEDLISRNLVMGMEKRPNGKLKTCRIHDLLHKFCLEKSKQENFLLRINRFNGEDTFPEKPKEYRLFVHSYEDQIDWWQPAHSNIRSLLLNVVDRDSLLWPHDMSFIFESFKLVKVLDLESINIGGSFPSEVQHLIHMRYFSAQTGANSIPSSIAKLWNLETFVVRGLGVEVILPSSLLTMVKLRNIHVNHRASLSLIDNMGESLVDSQLHNLETFSTPHLSYGDDAEMILRKMLKLRRLSCIFSGVIGYSEEVKGRCVRFPRLEFLSHLESLKLVSNSYPAKLPHIFSFPSTLKELTLSKFRLPWTQISTIGELRKLEILKLLLRAFEGDEWEVKDAEFPQLKYLELDDINIAQWYVSGDAFPMLEHLVLTKCKQLDRIPCHFDDAVSLRSIEVNWCSWSVADSAQEIQTTQREDMANDMFTVSIQPPDWSSSGDSSSKEMR